MAMPAWAQVGLLAHGNRAVHDNAYWSLKKISGLYLAADPKAWTAWLEQETNWWRERAPAILAQLDSDDLSVALSSVQQIARRRYPRHALAAELCRALDHPQHEVRRLAAVALGALRSRTALPGLLGCLDDEDPQVRSAACRALRSVTGLNLPPERAAWARAGY